MTTKQKLEKILEMLEKISTKTWESDGVLQRIQGYIDSWIDELEEEK